MPVRQERFRPPRASFRQPVQARALAWALPGLRLAAQARRPLPERALQAEALRMMELLPVPQAQLQRAQEQQVLDRRLRRAHRRALQSQRLPPLLPTLPFF